jgi:uracil-DNA glycosylase
VSRYKAALAAFRTTRDHGWAALPFFTDGAADRLMAELDRMAEADTPVLPSPSDLFTALKLTPLPQTRVVILGQDPYPTPGDAHGLAFSVNPEVRIPRSLGNIFKERETDLGLPPPAHGNLSLWAQQGVLLLNTCLTVEAGLAGSHRKLGWQELTDQMIEAVATSAQSPVFVLWGADAQAKRALIPDDRALIIESPHPSPLSARRGFFGSRPFSRTNAHLVTSGLSPVDWRT